MENDRRPSAHIIDLDNYDPFGTSGTLPGGLFGDPSNLANPFATAGNHDSSINNVAATAAVASDVSARSPRVNDNRFTNSDFSGNNNNDSKDDFLIRTIVSPNSANSNAYSSGGWQQYKNASLLSIHYYRSFFEIGADQVVGRAAASLLPRKGYLEKNITPNPDFYGPIWIAVTLIVSSAISHGITQFFHNAPSCIAVDTDIRRTSFVATVTFLYGFLSPAGLWAFLKYQGAESRQSLPSYVCLYGYSMTAFVPISVFWVIRVPVVLWSVMLCATALSGYALVMSLWPSLQGLPSVQARSAAVLVVSALHLFLAVALGSYAFEPSA